MQRNFMIDRNSWICEEQPHKSIQLIVAFSTRKFQFNAIQFRIAQVLSIEMFVKTHDSPSQA